ncbi:hypothetical protein [Cellulomonas sp. ATA003]|uniref:hypothetical protein n=1 Tax=Cellulomonas sp. ATA003 TaxID=3073064 RepID=UPI002873D761|nr:hypothetical protein [Cellulomonas sp. ATA003]WNB86533.1 hypothetical protein REH70_04675 [Cellulomonas sp. ATA003]
MPRQLEPDRRPDRPAERWVRAVALAALAAGCWFAWLGWDDTYQVDPATGVASGPYETWQVVGAVVTLAVVAGVGARWAGARPTVVGVTAGFTVAWSVTAASADDTGLWLVGALLVLVGVALLSGLVALATGVSRRRPTERGDEGDRPAR